MENPELLNLISKICIWFDSLEFLLRFCGLRFFTVDIFRGGILISRDSGFLWLFFILLWMSKFWLSEIDLMRALFVGIFQYQNSELSLDFNFPELQFWLSKFWFIEYLQLWGSTCRDYKLLRLLFVEIYRYWLSFNIEILIVGILRVETLTCWYFELALSKLYNAMV